MKVIEGIIIQEYILKPLEQEPISLQDNMNTDLMYIDLMNYDV